MGNEEGDIGFRPPHPGEYIREDILPGLKMNQSELAEHLGVSRQAVSKLLKEEAGVSTEMAVRLGKAFQNGARFWLALQMQHDLWAEQRRTDLTVFPIDWKAA